MNKYCETHGHLWSVVSVLLDRQVFQLRTCSVCGQRSVLLPTKIAGDPNLLTEHQRRILQEFIEEDNYICKQYGHTYELIGKSPTPDDPGMVRYNYKCIRCGHLFQQWGFIE